MGKQLLRAYNHRRPWSIVAYAPDEPGIQVVREYEIEADADVDLGWEADNYSDGTRVALCHKGKEIRHIDC